MVKSEKLPIKKYITIKEMLYTLTTQYEKERLIKFFEKLKFDTPEEKQICINTILYPNDLEIIKSFCDTLNEKELSKNLNIPIHILRGKAKEFSSYRTWRILKENEKLKQLAFNTSDMQSFVGELVLEKIR